MKRRASGAWCLAWALATGALVQGPACKSEDPTTDDDGGGEGGDPSRGGGGGTSGGQGGRGGTGGGGQTGGANGGAGGEGGMGGAPAPELCSWPWSDQPSGGSAGGGMGGAGGGGQTAPFAYDQRPANPTCKAPARPTGMGNDPFPKTLKATGCFDATDVKKPGSMLIPYAVNAPLWSDGTDKGRWMALPDGAKIQVGSDGDWTPPVGTVLVKDFALGGKKIETRLLVRHSDGAWAGYSYRWREDESEADLLESQESRFVGDAEWVYPSRTQCLDCHTEAAGRSLGLETAQLNGLYTYPNGKRSNQIATLEKMGVLDKALGDPSKLPALPQLYDKAVPVADRARAYLHGNCSHCHRPSGVKEVNFDFRSTIPLAMTGACNVPPVKNNYGCEPARVIYPGDPSASLISVRMHSTVPNVRMPQLGTLVVDEQGVALIDAWIRSLKTCN